MKKKFMAVYLGTTASMAKWNDLNETERESKKKKGMDAWKLWAEKNSKFILDVGSPLGKTKKIERKGISDTKNALTAYSVVEAESHEAAAKLFLEHPHFTIFPGDSIEIMECLPLP